MIHLSYMNEVEFKKYLEFMIPEYARDIAINFDLTLEQAMEESEMMINDLFKDGRSTEGQYLFHITDALSQEKVGMLWYSIVPEINQAFLYHIFIEASERGKGYGTKTLEKLQDTLKEKGVKSIGLSVFGSNDAAFRLYRKLGF
ncbi:GNAT family N-acetyltransferase [Fictibacillus iocasae]|uniref:GNAT family N-acetyltransferase n=1 Tax=Fictibacillus iocasae TaxID=2715437 RepID=A0ABW2NW97_9BACL